MGTDNLFKARQKERTKRKAAILKQKSSTWLIVCEGEETEPNYFKQAIDDINKNIPKEYKIKAVIKGLGKNTISLVKTAEDIINEVDNYTNTLIPYGQVFVVFDKDSFSDKLFNDAIKMCLNKGYIPLWSNQAIEYWFLLHFNYIDSGMNRKEYSQKLNAYFKTKGLDYKYQKNDQNIYQQLITYGFLQNARRNAKKIHESKMHLKPAKQESCTTVYKFFDEVDKRLNELK